MRNPKVGNIYLGYSRNLNQYWRFQVLAIVEKDGIRFLVCHKLYVEPCSGQLWMFDVQGMEVNEYPEMEFFLGNRSKSKAGFDVIMD